MLFGPSRCHLSRFHWKNLKADPMRCHDQHQDVMVGVDHSPLP